MKIEIDNLKKLNKRKNQEIYSLKNNIFIYTRKLCNYGYRISKSNNIHILILLIPFITIITVISLKGSNPLILIKGTVLDFDTKNPVSVDFEFASENGKSTKAKSNSNDGIFDCVLNKDSKYTISSKNAIIISGDNPFITPNTDSYIEIRKTYYVRKIIENMILFELDLFFENSEIIKSYHENTISKLREMSRQYNIKYWDIEVSTADCILEDEPTEVKLKKGKKAKNSSLIISKREKLEKILNFRIQNLTSLLLKHNIREREFTIIPSLVVNEAPKRQISKTTKNKKSKVIENETPPPSTVSKINVKFKIAKLIK